MSAVFRGRRAEASARLIFHRRGRDERADDGRAAASFSRTHEFIQIFFEPRIGFANALRVLNNCFAVGEKPGHGERHCDAMIAEARESRAA